MPGTKARTRRPSTDALAAAFHAAVAELFDFCAPDPTSGTVPVPQLLSALATAAPSVAEPYTAAVLALVVADAELAAEAFSMFADGAVEGGRVNLHQFTFAFHVGFGLLNAEAHVEALAGKCAGADQSTLGVDAVLAALRSQSDSDPIAALWIESPVVSTRAATRETFFDVSGRRGVEGGVATVDARRFITVFRTALLKRRRLTAVLRTLFKALAVDGSVSASESCVPLAAWQRFCARPGVARVMGRLLCAAATNYTLRAEVLVEFFGASDVGAAAEGVAGAAEGGAEGAGGITWAAFRARLCEVARKQRECALGALLFRSLALPLSPTRASIAAVRSALAQFPHIFCRAIGYSTARPHHHRPTYTLFEHTSFKYFDAKKAAELGFLAPFDAAQQLHKVSLFFSFLFSFSFFHCMRIARGRYIHFHCMRILLTIIFIILISDSLAVTLTKVGVGSRSGGRGWRRRRDGSGARGRRGGALPRRLPRRLARVGQRDGAAQRRRGRRGGGGGGAYLGAGDDGSGGGAKHQKKKHLAAMGASVYGKKRQGGGAGRTHHRGRSSKGGAGGVALVLGGGLALLAVGGLVAYALVGGSSERKDE